MLNILTKLAYQSLQKGKQIFGLVHKTLSIRLMNTLSPRPRKRSGEWNANIPNILKQRIDDLLEVDWQDANNGVYPKSLLFDDPWQDFFRYYPLLCLDVPAVWERAKQRRYQDFSSDVNTQGYPAYYVQNFHHQTDGYFSDRSAHLYDLQVEILFNGAADPMRRRILAPLKQYLGTMAALDVADQSPQEWGPKILDVACGTGRTLRMIRRALPQAALYGVDLSLAYLRKANHLLSASSGTLPQLMHANAEQLPYVDNYFDAVTSVFLFHELPGKVRQAVVEQAFRVIKPGGVFIICDSLQQGDSTELTPLLKSFPRVRHEPYYRHYTIDNLVTRLEQTGFTQITTSDHFMSKYWVAVKPIA